MVTRGSFKVWAIVVGIGAIVYSCTPAKAASSRTCLTSAARHLLERVEAQFGPVKVVSTCRPGARIAGTNRISRHASGNAIDFNAGARKQAIVEWLIANHQSGGVMTYAHKGHIHMDIGRRFVSLAGRRVRAAVHAVTTTASTWSAREFWERQ